jgi:hypothetical protein
MVLCHRLCHGASLTLKSVMLVIGLLASKSAVAQTTFIVANSCSFAANNGKCQNSTALSLPSHAGAVFAFATALCDAAAVDQPAVSLKLTLRGTGQGVDFYLAPTSTTVRPQSTRTTTVFTHPIKIHLKGYTQLNYEFQVPNSGTVGDCRLTIQGE